MKTKKTYPMNGVPLHLQAVRLNPASSAPDRAMLRNWVRANKHARPETLAAYTI